MLQENQWPPEGATVVNEQEEEVQDNQWPPKGAQVVETPEGDAEPEKEVVEQKEPEILPKDLVEKELAEDELVVYDAKRVEEAKKVEAEIEELEAASTRAQNKQVQNETRPKDLDYKKVVITDSKGNTKEYSYASVYNKYGDVEELSLIHI